MLTCTALILLIQIILRMLISPVDVYKNMRNENFYVLDQRSETPSQINPLGPALIGLTTEFLNLC